MENKKLKILQIVGSMNNGGVETLVMSYFRELHEQCEFTFVCFDDSTSIPEEEIKSLGGRVIVLPHVKHLHKYNKALDKVFKENHFDIVHCHLNTLSVFPLRIAKKNHCPIRISHSHSASSKKEFKRHIVKSILRLFSKTYANVYFASSEIAATFQFGKKAFKKGKVKIVKNGIQVSRFIYDDAIRKAIRKQFGVNDNQYVVGTVGRFCDTKNHKFILELAKVNKDIIFFIVGSGELEEELRNQVKNNHLDNVRIVVPSLDIGKYYSAFDMFVFPSFYEGFGLTALEAETNGLYVLSSIYVSKNVLVSNYGDFLPIEEKDIPSWSKKINEKHLREDHLKDVMNSGYDSSSASKELFEEYKKLLGR